MADLRNCGCNLQYGCGKAGCIRVTADSPGFYNEAGGYQVCDEGDWDRVRVEYVKPVTDQQTSDQPLIQFLPRSEGPDIFQMLGSEN